jgi:hypothetical protein
MEASFQKRLSQLEDYYPLKVDTIETHKRPTLKSLSSKAFDLAGELNKMRGLKPYYKDMESRRPRTTERVEPIEQEQKYIPFIEEPELEGKHDLPHSSGLSEFSGDWRGLLEGDNLFNQPSVQIDDGVGLGFDFREPIGNLYMPVVSSDVSAMLPY